MIRRTDGGGRRSRPLPRLKCIVCIHNCIKKKYSSILTVYYVCSIVESAIESCIVGTRHNHDEVNSKSTARGGQWALEPSYTSA
jgi:hypothetical protein